MKKEQLKENVKLQISSIKSEVTKLRKDYNAQSDADIKSVIWDKIALKEQELLELTEELDEIVNKEKNKARDELHEVINQNHLAYIATDGKYILIKNYSTTDERVNLSSQYLAWHPMIGVLNNLIKRPGFFSDLNQDDLRTAFEKANASYMIKTASFDNPKWDKEYVFNILEVQRKYWAPIDRGDVYNELFDDLIYSLGGGKAENIEHIEKWVAFKYLNPDKVKNTPGLNITGKPGGNGKGLFTQFLTSVFTPLGVTVIRGKNLTGGFNSIMEGKVITVLDDERKDKFPQDELKQNSGNGSIVIEPKGVDAYSVDSTATTIVLDNTGLVELKGGGSGSEDRRWSIISTELTLLEILQQKYSLTEEESKHLAEKIGELCENRIECGKWIAAMIKKHNVQDIDVLMSLHGADYQARLLEQKDNWSDIFERILPVFVNQGVIPFKFVKEIVEAETGNRIAKPQTLSSKFGEFLSRKGYKNVESTDVNINITFPGSGTIEKFKGSVRRIDPTARTFDYSLISSSTYSKKTALTKETIQIHDFADEDDDFTEVQNQPRYPATPLKNEKTALQTPTTANFVSGVKMANPAKEEVNPAKNTTIGPLLAKFMKESKHD